LARQEAARQEASRQEAIRQEGLRQEVARQDAIRQEGIRQEAARQEAIRQEGLRQEAARQQRQEAARQEAVAAETARQEAARQEATRQEGLRQEAGRQEAARRQAQEAGQRASASTPGPSAAAGAESARTVALAQPSVATVGAGQGPPSKESGAGSHTETLPPARPPTVQPGSSNSPRRRTLLGRTDRDVVLVMYAEGWRQKIEMNANLEAVREAKKQPYSDPVVTVALRSDGSVEAVTFNHTSGVAELDEAVRRIVQALGPYGAFPPDLAREYDVIEIRRVWTFDSAIRLFAGGR
jgi:outer membrane biosynthesis protein TonB